MGGACFAPPCSAAHDQYIRSSGLLLGSASSIRSPAACRLHYQHPKHNPRSLEGRRLKSTGLKRAFLTMYHVLHNLLLRVVSLLETSADGKNKQEDMIVIEIDAREQYLPKI